MGLHPRAVSRDLDWGIPVPVEGAEAGALRMVRRPYRLHQQYERVASRLVEKWAERSPQICWFTSSERTISCSTASYSL